MHLVTPPKRLDTHIAQTYTVLRLFMSLCGFVLPPLLVIGGLSQFLWLDAPLPVQNSLSAYYHAGSNECLSLAGVYRDLFVGVLVAISACLVVYAGFGKLENWLLNIAGVCLAGVAFFPMDWPEVPYRASCSASGFAPFPASTLLNINELPIHYIAAVCFFIAIVLVNVLTAKDTAKIIKDKQRRNRWLKIYSVARYMMPMTLGAVLLLYLVTGDQIIGDRLVLWLEWAGIWAFSGYWLLKSIEISNNCADVEAAHGELTWVRPTNAAPLQRQLQRR